MNTTNLPSPPFELATNTFVGRLYRDFAHQESSTLTRILLILAVALIVHVLVKITRHLSEWFINKSQAQKNPLGFVTQQPKFITLTRLVVSAITFVIYFFAIGLVLQEFGVNLTFYLTSASVVGLAISFGSQGLVQDIVIGLTLIFSDAMDIGDLVEIFGATSVIGRVEEIGLRFTVLRNFYNQVVFIPNRTIANVSRFPYGGVYAYADIQIPEGVDRPKAVEAAANVARGMWRQFGAIILSEPTWGDVETAEGGGWSFLRVHFKIWPGQGSLIEMTFRQQMVSAMKTLAPNYADWQVAVTYRAMTAPKK
ncbi:MAG TPA: mechanosensitive ion channel domain-containing protein [Verrucomicrobiae bacterium]|nr:mechanosensitive ion channel domain-containing protein [Verrucomicrobiae bacterium]